ncbi:MAG: right-handed parallel beta-helix repeat-containing protein [Tannerellaceae bacterium]
MKLSSLIFIALFLSQMICAEVRIYVSPNGNDTNSGSINEPLGSFEGAKNKIRALRMNKQVSDTIFVEVQGGIYPITHALTFTEEDSGTEQAPVVFCGNEKDRPILCGGKSVNCFEKVSPNLWRASIPEVADYGLYFEQLYVNGERRVRARTPNGNDLLHLKRVDEITLDTAGQNYVAAFAAQKIIVNAEELLALKDMKIEEWNDILISFYHKWEYTPRHIQQVNSADSAIHITGNGIFVYNKLNQDSRYKIENYRKALDQPGEWFLQRDGYLYYIPMPGETIENTQCIYPISNKLLTIAGKRGNEVSSIQFRNIRFESDSNVKPIRKYAVMQSAAEEDAAIMVDHAKHIEFLNCDIAHTGHHGIWFRENCSFSKMEHCHLYDLGCGGVKIGSYLPSFIPVDQDGLADTHHITIHNNIIQHGGYDYPNATGLTIFYASDNTVTHNDIADFRYSGVSVGWVWGYAPSPSKRNSIDFNHIHHLGWGQLSDMGGVYTLGASEGTSVSNNVIHHIHSFTYGGWGLYTDEGSAGIRMENNLVYKCKNSAFHQHYGKDNVIRNNIFALNLLSQMQLTRIEEHLSFSFTNNIVYYDQGLLYMDMGKDSWLKAQTVIDKNCFWNPTTQKQDFLGLSFSEWKKLGKDKHSILADPLFIDPTNFDFRFKSIKTAKQIGFKPFDYSRAGVYGDQEWKEKALLSKVLEDQFDVIMKNKK